MADFEFGAMPPQVDAAILETLAQAEVATIGHWRLWGFCDSAIRRIGHGGAIAGTAVTVACPADDNAALHYIFDLIRPGDIVVVERQGGQGLACAGETVARAASRAGVGALIIDGPCTDIQGIRAIGLPVWCRGVVGRTTRPGTRGGRINVPVAIGGVVVTPGDAVLCDDSGILVLRPAEAEREARKAIAHQDRSLGIWEKIENGVSVAELSGAKSTMEQAMARP